MKRVLKIMNYGDSMAEELISIMPYLSANMPWLRPHMALCRPFMAPFSAFIAGTCSIMGEFSAYMIYTGSIMACLSANMPWLRPNIAPLSTNYYR
jgi:hypothetical protein